MKLNGTHKFKAHSEQVFQAILNPAILKASIPGCDSVEYTDTSHINAAITTALPGLKGPYIVSINIAHRQDPNNLELQVQRKGRGGSINAASQINLTDEADGALLTYNVNAELEGPVAIANNPIGEGFVKNALNNFFKNLDKSVG